MRSRLRLAVTTLAASLVGIYLLLIAAAFAAQRSMMYPAPRGAESPQCTNGTLVTFTSPDQRSLHAYHVPARDQNPTVVIFHGNAEQLADQTALALEFTADGLGAFAIEYPGYGLSSKSKTTEANVYADAQLALEHLEKKLGVERKRMVLFGRSLGTGVAIEMARRGFGSRIILISAYTSMVELAERTAPFLPTRWLVLDRYDTLAKASEIHQPVLLIHGNRDNVVPAEMGKRVASRLPTAELHLLDGVGHNDIFAFGGDALMHKLTSFAATTALP